MPLAERTWFRNGWPFLVAAAGILVGYVFVIPGLGTISIAANLVGWLL